MKYIIYYKDDFFNRPDSLENENASNNENNSEVKKNQQTINNSSVGTSTNHNENENSPKVSEKNFGEIIKGLNKNDLNSSTDYEKEEGLLKNKEAKKEAPFSALIKYKSIRSSFLICNFLWFALSFTYYGISMGLKQNKDEIFVDGFVVYGGDGGDYVDAYGDVVVHDDGGDG
jgi:hypothetical protein